MTPTLTANRFDSRTLLNGTVLVLVCIVVAPFVVYAFPGIVGAQQSYVVLSGSMEPAIGVGDAVLVAPVAAETLGVGDVITFDRGSDIPTTHRIIDVVETESGIAFETKGDANEDVDPGLVRPAQVIGVVVLTIPYIGYVVEFAGTPVGFASLVVAPFALLAALELRDYMVARTDRDEPAIAAEVETESESGSTVETGAESATESGALTVTGDELTLGIIAFGLFAVYAGYVAFLVQTTWSFIVVAAALGLVVLLGAIRFQPFGTLDTPASTDGGHDTERVIDGEFHVTGGQPLVGVDSPAMLHQMAARNDRWVVRDGDVEYLFDDGVVFCTESAGTPRNETIRRNADDR